MFSLPPWTSAELRCDDPMPPVGRRCVVCGCVTVNKFVDRCFSHFRPVSLAAVIAEKRKLLARLQDEPEALQRKSCIAAVLGDLNELRMVHDDDAEASEPDAPSAGSESEPEEAPDGGTGHSDAPSATSDAPSAGSGSEPEEAPGGGTGQSGAPSAGDIAFSTAYARQLWQEASTGVTRNGVSLDAEQRMARVAKLKQNAATLAPRYRAARLARIGPLEQRFAAHLAATATAITNHVDVALQPLIARAEGESRRVARTKRRPSGDRRSTRYSWLFLSSARSASASSMRSAPPRLARSASERSRSTTGFDSRHESKGQNCFVSRRRTKTLRALRRGCCGRRPRPVLAAHRTDVLQAQSSSPLSRGVRYGVWA